MRFSTDRRIGEALVRILNYAELRKHLADDEHRDPLPIYGSARMYDRLPVARMRSTPREINAVARLRMSKEWNNPDLGA